MPAKYTPEQRIAAFWNKVDQSGGEDACWLWTAARDPNGYGRVSWIIRRRMVLAHRVSYELTYGECPIELGVLHSCDNPSCCNPKHLFLGTNLDNMRDRDNKGRVARGEQSGTHKLTDVQVAEIRARYTTGNVYQSELAAEYGVSQQHISALIHGLWRTSAEGRDND